MWWTPTQQKCPEPVQFTDANRLFGKLVGVPDKGVDRFWSDEKVLVSSVLFFPFSKVVFRQRKPKIRLYSSNRDEVIHADTRVALIVYTIFTMRIEKLFIVYLLQRSH